MATHSSIHAWKIPWTEEPGKLQSMGLQRVGHDWSDLAAAAADVVIIAVTVYVVRKDLNYFCLSESHGTLSFKIEGSKKEGLTSCDGLWWKGRAWSRHAQCVLHRRCGFTSVAFPPPSDIIEHICLLLYISYCIRIVYKYELIEFSHPRKHKLPKIYGSKHRDLGDVSWTSFSVLSSFPLQNA